MTGLTDRMDAAWRQITALRADDGQPLFPGAVLAASVGVGTSVRQDYQRVGGWARCYADRELTLLPATDRLPVRPDTIFDLASISKLFCSIVVLQLVEQGLVELDRPVAAYLPEFAAGGKGAVTVRQLLVHTSGFPALLPLWRMFPDRASRVHGVLVADLVAEPGSTYCYSDLNLITLGELAHRVTGRGLDTLVAEQITGPLQLVDTGYTPAPDRRPRIAATEDEREPDRGMVHGEVHDENAWSLGGVAGHAGVFSTAADLARLAEVIIDRGRHPGGRLLGEEIFAAMITNQTPEFADHDHGLGFEINQPWYMGRAAGPDTIGHTGYTGTSLVIDLHRRSFVILLTNRVHPSRDRGTVNPARVIVGDALADALADADAH